MAILEFQIVISKNGRLLSTTEWSEDREAVQELMAEINNGCPKLRAIVETRGRSEFNIQPVMMGT